MKTRRSFLTALLALPLAASFMGATCQPPTIPVVEAGLRDAEMVIAMIASSVDGYFAGHPNAALQTKIDGVITDTLSTLRLTESALAVANDLQAANVQAALQAFSDAFGQLVALVAQIGIQVKPTGTGAKKLVLPDGTIVIEPPVILRHLKAKKAGNFGKWMPEEHKRVMLELERWRQDPDYIPIFPDGVNVHQMGRYLELTEPYWARG